MQQAAPKPYVQVSAADARRLGVRDGDRVEVASRRGTVRAPAQVGDIERGPVFLPFDYGYWDRDGDHDRAANELTLTAWDPVSKQPSYKYAAVQVRKADGPSLTEAIADVAGKVVDRAKEVADTVVSSADKERVRVPDSLGLLRSCHGQFAQACQTVSGRYLEEPEVQDGLKKLAQLSGEAMTALQPFVECYGGQDAAEAGVLREALFPAARAGAYGLLRDLHDLGVLASEAHLALTAVMQAAKALRDEGLLKVCEHLDEQTRRQQGWLLTQFKHRAAHTLIVPS